MPKHVRRRRKSIRLKGWDYSAPGAYFVTICTHKRQPLFGQVVDGEMVLNQYGEIVREAWFDLPNHYAHVELDAFVVMPNHIHAIIILDADAIGVGAGLKPAPTRHPLSEIVRALKTFSARRINTLRGTPGVPVWQRNYYEHIIRNERALNAIRRYIAENPLRWYLDRYNPNAAAPDPLARDLWRMLQADARSRPRRVDKAQPRPPKADDQPDAPEGCP